MGRQFSKTPRTVTAIDTKNRRLRGMLPVPESLPILQAIEKYQPRAVDCQPPLLWDHAQGVHVFDAYGNRWLDFSSGVLVANVGHSQIDVKRAALSEIERGNMFSYCFPSAASALLAQRIVELSPKELNKVFFLTTGSETTECAIKLCRTRGRGINPEKNTIVTFEMAFHGRTLGAQQAGGWPEAKDWIGNPDPAFAQVPFPDGYRCKDTGFDLFERSLAEKGIDPSRIAGVMMESYQGGGASFAPPEYVRKLRDFCRRHDALLVFDEVQSGFGRTGKLFAFEHYEAIPDLVCLGKAISSSLPLAAVMGKGEILDLYGPGEMTSTHGGNPVSCAAALENIRVMLSQGVIENAARVGDTFTEGLTALKNRFPDQIGCVRGKGMVFGMDIVKPGSEEPDAEFAFAVVEECFYHGLLLFAPVGFGGATIKVCPPLIMSDSQAKEGIAVLNEVFTSLRDGTQR